MTNTKKEFMKDLGKALGVVLIFMAIIMVGAAPKIIEEVQHTKEMNERFGKPNTPYCQEVERLYVEDGEYRQKIKDYASYEHNHEGAKSLEELTAEGADKAYEDAVITCRVDALMY